MPLISITYSNGASGIGEYCLRKLFIISVEEAESARPIEKGGICVSVRSGVMEVPLSVESRRVPGGSTYRMMG
jgi:hypothetical protein